MKALIVALGAAAAFAVGGTSARGTPGRLPYYLNTTTTTVYVAGTGCGTITSTIYVTESDFQTADVGVLSSLVATTKTTQTSYVTVQVSSLHAAETLQTTASAMADAINPVLETTVAISEVSSDEVTTTSTTTGTSTSFVKTITATSTVTGGIKTSGSAKTFTTSAAVKTTTIMSFPTATGTFTEILSATTVTTVATGIDSVQTTANRASTDANTTGYWSSSSSLPVSITTENSPIMGSQPPVAPPVSQSISTGGSKPVSESYITTEYLTTTEAPIVQGASLTTSIATAFITSTPAPSVQSAEYTTYISTEYITSAYVYTYSAPRPPAETTTTEGSVVVVVSKVTVVPQQSETASVTELSSSAVLETHTLTLQSLHTLTETLVPETTIVLPPVTLTSLYTVTETLMSATTQSAVPTTLASLKTIVTSVYSIASGLDSLSLTATWSSLPVSSPSAGALSATSPAVISSAAASISKIPVIMSSQFYSGSSGWNLSSHAPSTVYSGSVSPVTSSFSTLNTYGTLNIPAMKSELLASAGFEKPWWFNSPSSTTNKFLTGIPTALATGSAASGGLGGLTLIRNPISSSFNKPSAINLGSSSATGGLGSYGSSMVPTLVSSNFSGKMTANQTNSLATLIYSPSLIPTLIKPSIISAIATSQAAINTNMGISPSRSFTSVESSSFGQYTVGSLTSIVKSSSTLTAFSSATPLTAQSSSPATGSSTSTSKPREFTVPPFTIPGSPLPATFSTFTSSSLASTITTPTATISGPKTSSTCGEHGDFTLNYDDIPELTASNNNNVDAEPMFSPYHQFYFSEGFVVVPLPVDPYAPSSGDHLLEFMATNSSSVPANPVPEGVDISTTGGIGVGYTEQLGCFNFNAYGASLGCDSKGPPCIFQVTGMRYDRNIEADAVATSQIISVPACPKLSNCALAPVNFDNTFVNITSIYLNATVAGVPKIWFLDDLRLGWTDNDCDSGLCRQSNV